MHHLSTSRIKRSMAAAAIGAVAVTSIAVAQPAEAKVVCSNGTWGGVWGWGDCYENGVPGPRTWRLEVSCTWGASVASGWITGPGHVDVKCPRGSARSSAIRTK